MSVTTLDRTQVRYFQTALASRTVEETSSGSKIIKSVQVFRAGKFKDSMGEQHTWESSHLQQMVNNFNLLRDRSTLPNVPIRDGHRSFFGGGGAVVGYVADLRIEGQDVVGNDILVADMEITEPDAFDKINRGTWRSRSSEIGMYEANDESMHWPVFMGVAWVDIPAVEGLFSNHQANQDKFTPVRDNEEGAVSHTNEAGTQSGGTASTTGTTTGNGTTSTFTLSVPTQEAGNAEGNEEVNEGAEGDAGGEGPPAGSSHSAPGSTPPGSNVTTPPVPPVHTFSVNGQPTTDFAAVQAHISNLETVLAENRDQARKDFVTGLASSNRIAATQVEAMTAHALSLTDDQYTAFAAMYTDAPESPLFSQHGQSNTTEPEAVSEVDLMRERVSMHRRGGTPEEKLKETKSYKRLMELTEGKG